MNHHNKQYSDRSTLVLQAHFWLLAAALQRLPPVKCCCRVRLPGKTGRRRLPRLRQEVQFVELQAPLQVRIAAFFDARAALAVLFFAAQILWACNVRRLCAHPGALGQPRQRSLLCGVLHCMPQLAVVTHDVYVYWCYVVIA